MDESVPGPGLGEHVRHEVKRKANCSPEGHQTADLGIESGTQERDAKTTSALWVIALT